MKETKKETKNYNWFMIFNIQIESVVGKSLVAFLFRSFVCLYIYFFTCALLHAILHMPYSLWFLGIDTKRNETNETKKIPFFSFLFTLLLQSVTKNIRDFYGFYYEFPLSHV